VVLLGLGLGGGVGGGVGVCLLACGFFVVRIEGEAADPLGELGWGCTLKGCVRGGRLVIFPVWSEGWGVRTLSFFGALARRPAMCTLNWLSRGWSVVVVVPAF